MRLGLIDHLPGLHIENDNPTMEVSDGKSFTVSAEHQGGREHAPPPIRCPIRFAGARIEELDPFSYNRQIVIVRTEGETCPQGPRCLFPLEQFFAGECVRDEIVTVCAGGTHGLAVPTECDSAQRQLALAKLVLMFPGSRIPQM